TARAGKADRRENWEPEAWRRPPGGRAAGTTPTPRSQMGLLRPPDSGSPPTLLRSPSAQADTPLNKPDAPVRRRPHQSSLHHDQTTKKPETRVMGLGIDIPPPGGSWPVTTHPMPCRRRQ